MKQIVGLISILVLFPIGFAQTDQPAKAQQPNVQIAVLLDTSGSMDGLIDQAKTRLWKIVNDLARAKKGGQAARINVALYEYGKSTIPASEGYLRMIVPLTTDLDRVSEGLFALHTNGGEEYCGQVIDAAVNALAWSPSSKDYKAIFIAGNEPFNQGSVDFRQSCQSAIAKGIIVNTIFCGAAQEGIQTFWKEGADLADGSYMTIDHNQALTHVAAPQDAEILQLSQELNQTYIAYGAAGKQSKKRQAEQDQNAMAMAPESAVQRTLTKAKAQYRNESWDLVDAVASGAVALEEMEDEALPAPMQAMSDEDRQAYVAEQAKQREALQQRLGELESARSKYVQEKAAQAGDTSLDAAMTRAIRSQAASRDFQFAD